jgi:hypothetical protein
MDNSKIVDYCNTHLAPKTTELVAFILEKGWDEQIGYMTCLMMICKSLEQAGETPNLLHILGSHLMQLVEEEIHQEERRKLELN